MHKIKSILIFVSVLVFFAGCVQIYLILRMSIFGFANLFFYSILVLNFSSIVIEIYKKNKAFVIASILFMFAFMSVKLTFNRIDNYYFNKAVSKGDVIKSDLKKYQKINKEFPESLEILYGKSQIPQYNIGVLKYHFRYYKTDTSYKIYFNLFEGRMFRNLGAYNLWTFYD